MALATRLNYPRDLDTSSVVTGTGVPKDQEGKSLINKLCKPKKYYQSTPFTRWTPELAPHDFKKFYEYCRQDVNAERAIYNKLNFQLGELETKVWRHTVIQNDRGLRIDVPLVQDIITVINEYKKEMTKKLIDHTNGEVTTGNQRDKMLEYCQRRGVELPDLTEATVLWAMHKEEFPYEIRKLMFFRRKLSKTSTAKYNKMLESICNDGTVKDNLIYSSTVTGRYAAAGLQIQNLPARLSFKKVLDANYPGTDEEAIQLAIDAFGDGLDAVKELTKNVMQLASVMVRPCLIPPTGHQFYVSDYSSIENRALHWEADDRDTLREFEQGLDQYITFASALYQIAYDKVSDQQRFHGKTAILGLGYMMGDTTYQSTAAGYGIDLTLAQAKATVNLYRSKYKLVKDFWFKLYREARQAVSLNKTTEYNGIYFRVKHNRLLMRLKSGRCIAYNSPKVESKMMPWGEMKPTITFMGINPYSRKWSRMQITPGRLTENLIQADCREILVQGLLNVEMAGYKVLGSLHDEGIAIAKEGDIEQFNQLMCDMPSWTGGLPLSAGGWVGMRYRK
jgi:DNA polymerase